MPSSAWKDKLGQLRLVVVVRALALIVAFFFFNDTATTEIYTLSLHDALPILAVKVKVQTESSLAVVLRSGARMQGSGATTGVEPEGWLVKVKSTVPWGGLLGAVSVSVTRAVQLAGVLAGG